MAATAQNRGKPITASIEGHIYKSAKVPAGFTVTKFAENLNKPRMLATGAGGTVYVTDRGKATVTMLRDTNNDGKADRQQVVTIKEKMHGIAPSTTGKLCRKGGILEMMVDLWITRPGYPQAHHHSNSNNLRWL